MFRIKASSRSLTVAVGALLLALRGAAQRVAAGSGPRPSAGDPPGRGVGTWAAALAAAVDNGCADCTIRDVVHTTIGGVAVRVRLSNRYGTAALPVRHTTVA